MCSVVAVLAAMGGIPSVLQGCGSSGGQPNGTGGAPGPTCRAEAEACAVTVDCCDSLICVSNACVAPPSGSGGRAGTGGVSATGGATGTGGAPAPISTQWTVQIQASTWTCIGQMALTVTNGDGTGSWNCAETSSGCTYRQIYVTPGPCLSFAGPAAARFNADNSVLMQLSTDATHAIGVEGTLGVDRVIGTAMFADGSAPFTAILRVAQ